MSNVVETRSRARLLALFALIAALLLPAIAEAANGGVTFNDIAANHGAGINYSRQRSDIEAIFDAIKQLPFYGPDEILATPGKGRGAPGVAILDYDRDGDLDLYVTNGPGTANSLYANQFAQTGQVTFVDVGEAAGVGATEQDSMGVCYGDIDNDGDLDLFVTGRQDPNLLFENQGDGTFRDITASSGVGEFVSNSMSCSMGDINNDGLLDIAVANIFDLSTSLPQFVEYYSLNQPNQLLLNRGDNVFEDVSESSGFRDVYLPDAPPGSSTGTWAIAMVDYDQDGDIDILHADDQGATPEVVVGGLDRGYIQVFENDGTGHFTNTTQEVGLDYPGGWMGLAFADFNGDGLLDVFSTNFGNHARVVARGGPIDFNIEGRDSRWFLRKKDGTYADSHGRNNNTNTPFGWGVVAPDYDNDGDNDILFHGGMDAGAFVILSPAALLNNDGKARFSRDRAAFAGGTDHLRREVNGVATGDLNNDGFLDVVTASSIDIPTSVPLTPAPQIGGEWDVDAAVVATFNPIDPTIPLFQWNGYQFPDGTMSVELNSGGNGNKGVKVRLLGTKGITDRGRVNRDGIGALVKATPVGSKTSQLQPVLGGGSYASESDLSLHFGLGKASEAVVDVAWPGGTRNRFYGIVPGSPILLPEIPCSFDVRGQTLGDYLECVIPSLDQLAAQSWVTERRRTRLLIQALRAYLESH
ncbi:MAG TPA: CRTAC1 family protein [Thermoanaerobaculia bacterium]|nr:CRTAC1 family protein [Thermoanaerobaculia bacterium]